MNNKRLKTLNLILPFISIGTMLMFWAIASKVEDNVFILPSVSQTVESLFALLKSKQFYHAILTTFSRDNSV